MLAPTNLGLRPNDDGSEPGTWRAPKALLDAGLADAIATDKVVEIPHPIYEFDAQPGTRIRNGNAIRRFSLAVAHAVRDALQAGKFPLVIGGDCSTLLGSLYGARLAGTRGLIHVDGHSDFYHPKKDEAQRRLGAAAGMDLALATGRGEELLTRWPGLEGPLAADEDAIQIGEREAADPDFHRYYGDIERTQLTRFTVQTALASGIEQTADAIVSRLRMRGLDRVWLHVDLDVLDQTVMPAVDSPGSPGLTFAQLDTLLGRLADSERIAGADVAIYDPERDPHNLYSAPIVATLGKAFGNRT